MPTSETGTATAGMRVARTDRRNANTTRVTRSTEITSVSSTSCSDARMVWVWSITTDMVMAGGIAAPSSGSRRRTPSTVSMMLAPGWRKITSSTAGRPFARPVVRTSSTESSTRATSESCTGRPPRKATITGA